MLVRNAKVFFEDDFAGLLVEVDGGRVFYFQYDPGYSGPPVSLTMPVQDETYRFDEFPPFFDGLLPEGFHLEALLRQKKLDRSDKFGQLLIIGADTVGAVTVKKAP
ncbi:MAG: HipA N-terminal domain-containing protein [Proteobacteria bacterium]|nr:HipA N-terminal domain-containing protein [Pseudomonadota bacterium]MBU1639422.1 HipA N-terminal domain-containing protein [Pseudomonadota bacterium]